MKDRPLFDSLFALLPGHGKRLTCFSLHTSLRLPYDHGAAVGNRATSPVIVLCIKTQRLLRGPRVETYMSLLLLLLLLLRMLSSTYSEASYYTSVESSLRIVSYRV